MRRCQRRQAWRAVPRQDCERLHGVTLDMRDRSRAGEAGIVDPAGDQVLDGRRRSAVGHMRGVDAEAGVEQRTGEMWRRACARRAILHLAWICSAKAASSGRLFAGKLVRATNMIVCSTTSATGAKSVPAL